MKRVLVALLCVVMSLSPLYAVGEEIIQVNIDPVFTLRENQPEHIDESIWPYYAMYTVRRLLHRNMSIDSLLEQMESSRVYCSKKQPASDGVRLDFGGSFALEFALDDNQLIQEVRLIVSCPIHRVNYICELDIDTTESTLVDQLDGQTTIVHSYMDVETTDRTNACLSYQHIALTNSSLRSTMEALRVVSLYADDPQNAERRVAADLKMTPYYKTSEMVAYVWEILKTKGGVLGGYSQTCKLMLYVLTDSSGEPTSMALSMSPPLLQDLFESPYMYDPSALDREGGPYSVSLTEDLVSPLIILQCSPALVTVPLRNQL